MRIYSFSLSVTTKPHFETATAADPAATGWIDREVELPGRGTMSVRHVYGPPGARTLVLLHGLAATGRLNWHTSVPALASHFNVVVVDHRGHGRGIRTTRFRLADCADDIVALADQLAVERLIAVGYSMGGPIAKLCWSRHRDRVEGLVLCATARSFFPIEARGVASAVFPGIVVAARLLPEPFRLRIIDGMLEGIPAGHRRDRLRRELAATDPATVLQATRAVIRFSSHDWVADIDVPTAVLITTRDRLVPTQRQYELAAALPRAKVFRVDGDHFVCVRPSSRFVPTLLQACHYVSDEIAGRRVDD